MPEVEVEEMVSSVITCADKYTAMLLDASDWSENRARDPRILS